jgi:hypothetical protein
MREHPLGLREVIGRPEVQLPGGAVMARLLRLFRLPDQLIGQRGPSPQEIAGAGVGALGGGFPDRPAGPVDLVNEATAVQCGNHTEIPDVIAGEELEHESCPFMVRPSGRR